mmetsp:Transcript_19269/g.77154  ORF Transcript_19269/g.77154 Transcript_19269/m.77154 type:complete len:208 (-) Transcript_19269:199-822(-)
MIPLCAFAVNRSCAITPSTEEICSATINGLCIGLLGLIVNSAMRLPSKVLIGTESFVRKETTGERLLSAGSCINLLRVCFAPISESSTHILDPILALSAVSLATMISDFERVATRRGLRIDAPVLCATKLSSSSNSAACMMLKSRSAKLSGPICGSSSSAARLLIRFDGRARVTSTNLPVPIRRYNLSIAIAPIEVDAMPILIPLST